MNWDFVQIVDIPNIGSAKLPDAANWENPNIPYPLQAYDQAFIVEGCYERFKGIQPRPTGFVAGDEKISNAMVGSNILHSLQEIRRQILGISWLDPTKPLEDRSSFVGPPTYDDLYLRQPFVTGDDIASAGTGGPPTKQALIDAYKDLKRLWRRDFGFSINTDNLEQVHSNIIRPQDIVEGCGWAYCNNKAGRSDYQDSGYFRRTAYPGIKLEGLQIEDQNLYTNVKVLASYSVLLYATDETHPMVLTQWWHKQWFDGAIQFDRVTGDFYIAMDESAWSMNYCKSLVDIPFPGMGDMTNYTDPDTGYVYDRTVVRCEFGVNTVVMDYDIKTKF